MKEKEIIMFQLSQLTIDPNYQPRVGIDPATVEKYAELMREGHEFDPIDIFHVGSIFLVVSGFHRAESFQAASSCIPCIVHAGTYQDALIFALGANKKNGLATTEQDDTRAVTMGLQNFTDKSERWIAELVGKSQSFVHKIKNQLISENQLTLPDRTEGRDGKSRPSKMPKKEKPAPIEPKPTSYTAPDSEQGEFDNIDNITTAISDNCDSSNIDGEALNENEKSDEGEINVGTSDIHSNTSEDNIQDETIIDPIDGKVCQPLFAPVEETVVVKRSVEFLKFSQFWKLAISEFAKITDAEDKKLALTTVHSFSISNE